jgi:tRNA A-37 threonylcarbamoyl transferase component Bud32
MEDLTGKQLGQYRIVAPLGEGGMAAVYKAYQASVERYVALKILPRHYASDPDFIRRFKREAKIIAGLAHLNILPVHDYGETEGYTYIVMRYVEGGTLTNLLQGKPLLLPQISRVISQVAAALDYAHAKGVVHRDVKPSNVLMDEQGNCLLSDFGVARMIEATGQFTATGTFIGTPTYASPEQALGQSLDGRSDVYSLGVVLYEMATGRPPFDAETPMAILIKHVHDPLPMPRTINPALSEGVERVILKALAKEPENRYQTAGEVARALAAAATAEVAMPVHVVPGTLAMPPGPEKPPVVSVRPRPQRGRRIPVWGWVAGGLIVLCLVAGLLGGVGVLVPYLVRGTATATSALVAHPTTATVPVATLSAILTAPPATIAAPGVTALAVSTAAPASTATPSVSAETSVPNSRAWQNWTQVHSFPAPGDEPTGIVRVGDNLLVNVPCSNRIYRLDLQGNLVSELEMPKPGCGPRDIGLAWDSTSLWGTWWNEVIQIDPDTGQALSDFYADLKGCSIAWDGSSLWVVDRSGNLSAYDRNGQRLRRLAIPVFGVVSAITWVDGELWMLDEFGKVTRFDGDFLEVGSFSLSSACGVSSFHEQKSFGLYWDGESLWVADAVNSRIYQCAPGE